VIVGILNNTSLVQCTNRRTNIHTDGHTWIFHILTPSSFLSIMSNNFGRPEPRRMLNMADVPAKVWPRKVYEEGDTEN